MNSIPGISQLLAVVETGMSQLSNMFIQFLLGLMPQNVRNGINDVSAQANAWGDQANARVNAWLASMGLAPPAPVTPSAPAAPSAPSAPSTATTPDTTGTAPATPVTGGQSTGGPEGPPPPPPAPQPVRPRVFGQI